MTIEEKEIQRISNQITDKIISKYTTENKDVLDNEIELEILNFMNNLFEDPQNYSLTQIIYDSILDEIEKELKEKNIKIVY